MELVLVCVVQKPHVLSHIPAKALGQPGQNMTWHMPEPSEQPPAWHAVSQNVSPFRLIMLQGVSLVCVSVSVVVTEVAVVPVTVTEVMDVAVRETAVVVTVVAVDAVVEGDTEVSVEVVFVAQMPQVKSHMCAWMHVEHIESSQAPLEAM